MKKLYFLLFAVILFTGLSIAQDSSGDSEETLLEQQLALASENSTQLTGATPIVFSEFLQVTHPLFVGVSDVTVQTYQGNPATNDWIPAFLGYQVWGAAFDVASNKVYFNNGSTLYSWIVGTSTFDTLGTITDSLGATQSVVSLAFYNGELYATKNIANEAVWKINLSTLVAVPYIDYIDADFDFGGLAIDQSTGEIYGTNDDATPNGTGLFKINMDGSGTLIAPYPVGETDIDGLAISESGIAYLIIDEAGNIYSVDIATGTYGDTLTSPWTTAETFSGGTWIYEMSSIGILLVNDNTVGTDSVEARLNVLGETYTRMTAANVMAMPTSDWLMYDAVFWIGIVSNGAEIDSATAYLNAGGNLFVADNDQGWSTNATPFFQNYLMALYQSDAGSDGVITGTEMMDGVTTDISSDPYPDDVLPNTGTFGTGVPIFIAPTTTTYAGMRGDGGTFRTMYLCWDPQHGTSYSANLEIITRGLAWLRDGIIPVELTSFTASVSGNDVELAWETATEINNNGFSVERKDASSEFADIGFVPGYGTTTEPRAYSFIDPNLNSGTYTYRLRQIDFDGTVAYSDEVSVDVIAPVAFGLAQNYPNPFNPSTKISFSLAVDSRVTLKVFDILGQEVTTLVNRDLSQGVHNLDFNGNNINSGVYFYRIEAKAKNGEVFTDVKKMMLIK